MKSGVAKFVIGAILVVLLLAAVGWLSFGNSSDQATITIEKEEIKQDSKKVFEEGKELIDDVQE